MGSQSFRRGVRVHAVIDVVVKLPVRPDLDATSLGDQYVPRPKLLDALEHRERLRHVEVGQVVIDGGGSERSAHRGMSEQRLDLGSPEELTVRDREEQLLDPDPVPRQEQVRLPGIPEREGEHALEADSRSRRRTPHRRGR
jgi:hypothetical protein